MALAEATGARLLPVDSEHSALHQLIGREAPGTVERLVLTASGGPFRGREDLAGVSVDDALAHPTWRMGGRITIDSATLMNKGFEAIEAHHLFGVPYERIDVVVHPQSLVHSLIELNDGSSLAHLGYPDMRVPISYALHFPERADVDVPRLDLAAVGALTFEAPDPETFACLRLALEAGEAGGTAPCVLNAADEVAVAAFLDGRIPFTGIAAVIERVLEEMPAAAGDPLRRPLRRRRRGAPAQRGAGSGVDARMSWLWVFLGFSLLIVLHEGGHFVAAKATGMRVERFFLFFGPTIWSFKRGETEYGIKSIPLGGYVKITGMNPEEEVPPEDEDRRLLPPAGLEADRRGRRGAGGEHRPRLRDPLRRLPLHGAAPGRPDGRRDQLRQPGREGAEGRRPDRRGRRQALPGPRPRRAPDGSASRSPRTSARAAKRRTAAWPRRRWC